LHVDQKVKQLRRGELLKIFNEHDALVQQASEIIHRFQNWSEAVGMKHEAKRQLIVDLSERYSENIGEVIEGFNQEKDGYLREIEALHERVAVLQTELSGGLTEPEFVDAKFNPDLDLGNAICRQIFYQTKIPLRFCKAYTSDDGITHLGFMTSKRADKEAIACRINGENKALAGALGLYKIESVAASDVLEGVERNSRPSFPSAGIE
jgi:gas vesicle protein